MSNNDHFKESNIPELLGFTPVSMVSDREIWEHLVTPQVKAMLGDIVSREVTVRERTEGDFPGDEVSNLNDHLLFGGLKGFVRFPFINTFIKTKYGALIIKRDGVKFKVFAWYGKPGATKMELIFKVALRDRRYDGTKRANDTALLDFEYDDPELNRVLELEGMPENAKSVELSVYGYLPGSLIVDATGDQELNDFVASPFRFVDQPEKFLELFNRAWKSTRSPGQTGSAVPDVARLVPAAVERFAVNQGYDYIENASSHYHVARWAESIGYRYTCEEQDAAIKGLTEGIKRLKDSGQKFQRHQESWVCVLQHLPRKFIPDELYLGGARWPQDNIGQQNLWMYKPLSERAIEAAKKAGKIQQRKCGSDSKQIASKKG